MVLAMEWSSDANSQTNAESIPDFKLKTVMFALAQFRFRRWCPLCTCRMQANGFPLAGMIFIAALLPGNADAWLAVTDQRVTDTASRWRCERVSLVDEDDFPSAQTPGTADLKIEACLPVGRCTLGAEFCDKADESDPRPFGNGASCVRLLRTLGLPGERELELLPNRGRETTGIVNRNLARAVLGKARPTIEP
jgi:hypothetical protein